MNIEDVLLCDGLIILTLWE